MSWQVAGARTQNIPQTVTVSCNHLPTDWSWQTSQGWIIHRKFGCIVYNTYCIVLCIVLCIIFTYDFKIIQPESSCIIHNRYTIQYVLCIKVDVGLETVCARSRDVLVAKSAYDKLLSCGFLLRPARRVDWPGSATRKWPARRVCAPRQLL